MEQENVKKSVNNYHNRNKVYEKFLRKVKKIAINSVDDNRNYRIPIEPVPLEVTQKHFICIASKCLRPSVHPY